MLDLKYIPGVGTLVLDNLTQNDTVNSDILGMSVSKSISCGPVSSLPLISKVSEKSTKKKFNYISKVGMSKKGIKLY